MAKLEQFLDLLNRPGVREVVLQSNSQPAVRVDSDLRPVARDFLSTEHILAIVSGSSLARVLPKADEPRQTATFEHGGRLFAVKMARFGDRIQVRIAHSAAHPRRGESATNVDSRRLEPPSTDDSRAALDADGSPHAGRDDATAESPPRVAQGQPDHQGDEALPPVLAAPSPSLSSVSVATEKGGQPVAASTPDRFNLEPDSGAATRNLPRFARPLRPQRRISTEIEAIPLQTETELEGTVFAPPPPAASDTDEDDELPPVLGFVDAGRDGAGSTRPSRPSSVPSDPPPVATRTDSIPAIPSMAPELAASTYPSDAHEPMSLLAAGIQPVAEMEPLGSGWHPAVTAVPDTRSLAELVIRARSEGASDLHVFSGQPAWIRVRGDLCPTGSALPHDDIKRMLLSLLSPQQLDELEERGHIEAAFDLDGAGRVRANVCRQRAGLKGCFRLIPDCPSSVEALGLPPQLKSITQHRQGLVLVSGPAGHGKSTTLSALVHLFNESRPVHIVTVEEPIEVVHGTRRAIVSQREVGKHAGSFSQALHAALREDPDIIVVGELRDAGAAEIVLTACQAGHLVLATLNAPSAQRAIERFVDLFPCEQQGTARTVLAGALKLVVAQRLLRHVDDTTMVAAVEIVTGGIALWTLIRDNKLVQLPALQRRGRHLGMVPLADAVRLLQQQGKISIDEAKSLVNDPRAATPGRGQPAGSDSTSPNHLTRPKEQ